MSSTQNTGEGGWPSLLHALTDEELGQYGDLANDQVRREVRWLWAQMLMSIAALGLAGWALSRGLETGFDRSRWLSLLGAAALLYWPYRSARIRRLWKGHERMVKDELARRQASRA